MLNKKKVRLRIESIMQDNTPVDKGWPEMGLAATARLYGLGVRLRKEAYARGWIKKDRLGCAVVSVGNLTVGGTGKTPATIYLARMLQSYGFRMVVVSRGYKGSAERKGGVVSDGKDILMSASASGDEAHMMARVLGGIPVMAGRDRFAIAKEAVRMFDPHVILLDDAFQHIRLERDIDLVLLDAGKPFGNGKLLPRGILREEKEALHRASAIVLTRAGKDTAAAFEEIVRYAPGKPIFSCRHRPYVAGIVPAMADSGIVTPPKAEKSELEFQRGRRGYVFSGIARNDQYQRNLEEAGIHVCGTSFFGDHHWYAREELKTIMQSAAASGADMIFTTEKDFARIPPAIQWPLELAVIGVKIQFPDDVFDHYIQQTLQRRMEKH